MFSKSFICLLAIATLAVSVPVEETRSVPHADDSLGDYKCGYRRAGTEVVCKRTKIPSADDSLGDYGKGYIAPPDQPEKRGVPHADDSLGDYKCGYRRAGSSEVVCKRTKVPSADDSLGDYKQGYIAPPSDPEKRTKVPSADDSLGNYGCGYRRAIDPSVIC